MFHRFRMSFQFKSFLFLSLSLSLSSNKHFPYFMSIWNFFYFIVLLNAPNSRNLYHQRAVYAHSIFCRRKNERVHWGILIEDVYFIYGICFTPLFVLRWGLWCSLSIEDQPISSTRFIFIFYLRNFPRRKLWAFDGPTSCHAVTDK